MAQKLKEMTMETALARRLDDQNEPLTNEAQRKQCFGLFNSYWENASNQGIEFDVVGTMSISASLFAIVAKHGKEMAAEFVDDLAKSIREDEFSFQRTDN
jgi:hypothetical protein